MCSKVNVLWDLIKRYKLHGNKPDYTGAFAELKNKKSMVDYNKMLADAKRRKMDIVWRSKAMIQAKITDLDLRKSNSNDDIHQQSTSKEDPDDDDPLIYMNIAKDMTLELIHDAFDKPVLSVLAVLVLDACLKERVVLLARPLLCIVHVLCNVHVDERIERLQPLP